jgi:hypothetical protein
MGVIQRGYGARFVSEALRETFFRYLDSDDSVEAGVSCFIHVTHSAFAQR